MIAITVSVLASFYALYLAIKKQRPVHVHFGGGDKKVVDVEKRLNEARARVLLRDAKRRKRRDDKGRFA